MKHTFIEPQMQSDCGHAAIREQKVAGGRKVCMQSIGNTARSFPPTHMQTHTDTHKICFLVPSTWWKPQMSPMPWWLLQMVLFKLRKKCYRGHGIMKVMWCIIHFPPVIVTPLRRSTEKLQVWRNVLFVFFCFFWLCSSLAEEPDCHSFFRFLQQPSSTPLNCKCTAKINK